MLENRWQVYDIMNIIDLDARNKIFKRTPKTNLTRSVEKGKEGKRENDSAQMKGVSPCSIALPLKEDEFGVWKRFFLAGGF